MIMIPVHRGTATSPCTLFRVKTSHTAEPQVTVGGGIKNAENATHYILGLTLPWRPVVPQLPS